MDSVSKPKFVILGAGINGLTCAFRLSEKYPRAGFEIISENFTPNTTSDVAAGLWEPYLLGSTPMELVRKWSRETYNYFHGMWRTGYANECGICLVPWIGLCLEGSEMEDVFWKDFVFGFREISGQRLQRMGKEHNTAYCSGYEFVTFTCEPTKLLQFYTKILESRGVKIRKQRIECFQALEVSPDSIVINCLGLGSGEIMTDAQLKPTRGQIRRIKANWIFHAFVNGSAYVIPNTESVTLGGTKQKGDNDLNARAEDAETIRTGCYDFLKALKHAPLVGDLVGLRPTRTSLRLELEWFGTENRNRFPVIHNYGHGGSGITLAWGCAGEVLHIVHNVLCGTTTGSCHDCPRGGSKL
ncbi:D-aspartate oxidase-like [Toxorhynchites rutilus septentrionalis]|uniref:D-aspartate oxidase-like n=1 Tax=Toxorhynchites rutilus septentrionalis TaxID=329112 RepID=UPI002478DE5C|nr:D-aspartate oxidase-like [Toxorhynchites rutilus septentrionalis]